MVASLFSKGHASPIGGAARKGGAYVENADSGVLKFAVGENLYI